MATYPYYFLELYRFSVILYKPLFCLCLAFFGNRCHFYLSLCFSLSGGDGDPGEDRSGSGLIQGQGSLVAVNQVQALADVA